MSVELICKWSDTLWPVGRVRLFADYTISLSSLCRLIWKHGTTKMLVRYMMPSVCLRLRQFSQLSLYSLYGAVYSAYPILLWWSRECVLYLIIIIKPEVWIINHCLGLGHETMVCAVCLTMFFCVSKSVPGPIMSSIYLSGSLSVLRFARNNLRASNYSRVVVVSSSNFIPNSIPTMKE